jgi:hypothetical protein
MCIKSIRNYLTNIPGFYLNLMLLSKLSKRTLSCQEKRFLIKNIDNEITGIVSFNLQIIIDMNSLVKSYGSDLNKNIKEGDVIITKQKNLIYFFQNNKEK